MKKQRAKMGWVVWWKEEEIQKKNFCYYNYTIFHQTTQMYTEIPHNKFQWPAGIEPTTSW